MRSYVELFLLFFKMSAVTFGGGYAMLPILEREIFAKRSWLSKEEIIDYYAVSQGLPGIIAINVAIFIGKRQKGFWGGVVAALGIVAPCIIIITAIATFLGQIHHYPAVQKSFLGISIGVTALIFSAIIDLWKKAIFNVASFILFILAFILIQRGNLSPIALIFIAGIFGIGIGHHKKERRP